jgi:hypothetical protein
LRGTIQERFARRFARRLMKIQMLWVGGRQTSTYSPVSQPSLESRCVSSLHKHALYAFL